jgi:hypothetical protein
MVLLEGVLHVQGNFTGHSPRKERFFKFLFFFLEMSVLNRDTPAGTYLILSHLG